MDIQCYLKPFPVYNALVVTYDYNDFLKVLWYEWFFFFVQLKNITLVSKKEKKNIYIYIYSVLLYEENSKLPYTVQ